MEAAKKIFKKFYLVFVLALAILIFSLLSKNFFTVNNLTNVFVQNAWTIIASIGISMIMIGGGADLSVSYQMSMVSVVTAMLMMNAQLPVWLSVLCGVLLGGVMGFINGFFTVRLKVHPMVITLATMTIYQGTAYLLSGSKSFFNLPTAFKAIGQEYIGPVPVSVIIMVAMVIIASVILNKTYFGRYIYAIGGNEEAARLAGINVKFIRVAGFVVAGMFVAIAAVILTARTGSANAAIATDAVFDCITACVLGGISFSGGGGKISGVVTGVLIIGVLGNGMQLIGMGIYPQYIAKGIILVAAIAFDTYQKTAKVKKAEKSVAAAQ